MADEIRTDMNPQTNENEKKKFWKQKWFRPAAIAVLAAGIVISVPFIKDYKDTTVPTEIDVEMGIGQDSSNDGEGLLPDPDAHEYVEPVKQETESGGVSVPGWSSLDFPADTSEVTVDFFNPEENEGKYTLTFELRLPDESEQGYEVLYSSGLVEAGLHIQKINLSRGLEAGVYDATIHVQPYRMDENKTATNNADLKTKLIVS